MNNYYVRYTDANGNFKIIGNLPRQGALKVAEILRRAGGRGDALTLRHLTEQEEENTDVNDYDDYDDNETLTARELRENLVRRGLNSEYAKRIIGDIKAHREPEWKTGDIVKDALDVVYRHTEDVAWEKFGTSFRFNYAHPKRPLRLLRDLGPVTPEV